MADEGGHAALCGLGEGDHAVDLLAPEGELGVVAGAPGPCVRGAHRAVDLERRGTLRGELSEDAVESVDRRAQAGGEGFAGAGFRAERGGNAGELRGSRVVALEKELMHASIGEGVQQNGARGEAVAAGAANLLVEALDRCGQGEVENGADVGLIDAHAKGDGGDDDGELAAEKAALDTFAGGRVEAGVVGVNPGPSVHTRSTRSPSKNFVELDGDGLGDLA